MGVRDTNLVAMEMKTLNDDKGNPSSMRLYFILTGMGAILNMVAVAIYIIRRAWMDVGVTGWTEMGIFFVGVASVLTGVAWQKVQQKKVENG